MCVPAKGLQMTIKAFIKTERKKRGAEAAVPAVEPAATPAEPTEIPTPAIAAPAGSESAAVAGGEEENVSMIGTGQDAATEGSADPAIQVSYISYVFPCTYASFSCDLKWDLERQWARDCSSACDSMLGGGLAAAVGCKHAALRIGLSMRLWRRGLVLGEGAYYVEYWLTSR